MAGHMARRLGNGGHWLVYGGGRVGLKGAVARAVHAASGTVGEIIPDALRDDVVLGAPSY